MHLGELFELYNIKQYDPFRITRDSDLDIDEDTEDLMAEIKKSIRKRKRGEPVRLEFGKKCNREIREFLVDALDVTEREIYFQRGPLDLTFLSKFAHIKGCEDMCFEPIVPVNPPAEFCGYDDILRLSVKRTDLCIILMKALMLWLICQKGGNRSECSCHQANLVPCQRKFTDCCGSYQGG